MAQTNKICGICGTLGHSQFYCPSKPKKPISKVSKKQKLVKPKVKRVTRSQLVKKLDTVFSQYIRQRDSIDGMATCVTCGDTRPWEYQQNGHFYTRGRYPTRWDEANCNIQCVRCNVFLKGNYINYTMYMIDKYGREFVDNLETKSKSNIKITTVELQEMIDYYKNITKMLDKT
jgi:hypothetical protein